MDFKRYLTDYLSTNVYICGLPRWHSGEDSACQRGRGRRRDPWVGKIPWRRTGQCTPAFLPRESHGQKSLVSYSPRGHKELDVTEQLSTRVFLYAFYTRVYKISTSTHIGKKDTSQTFTFSSVKLVTEHIYI